MTRKFVFSASLALLTLPAATTARAQAPAPPAAPLAQSELIEVAQSPRYQWNGIAISPDGRLFASFPRLYGDETISVAEILKDGSLRPFPGGDWNTWSLTKSEHPEERFVNINTVHTDKNNNLWVVDTGTVSGKATPGGPKLVKFNLATGKLDRVYRFPDAVLPEGSGLNDVRIGTQFAYLTDSGKGAIIVLNLATGASRRLLDKHPSTKADPTIIPIIQGRKVLSPKGEVPKLNANNLELTPDESSLLYKTSFGYRWYRVPTAALTNPTLTDDQVAEQVQPAYEAMPTGGSTMDGQGNVYMMDLERRSIWQVSPSGMMQLVIHDPRLLWPDASWVGADGNLYVPLSQNHNIPIYNRGRDMVEKPFRLYKIKIAGATATPK